jgi:hypothetical protein
MNRTALFIALGLPTLAAAEPPARHRGEFLQMWDAVVDGSMMGPGDGWFKPSLTRYTWDRFQKRFDRDKDGRVTAVELGNRTELFAALDRDASGAIAADDLDWSDNSTYSRQLGMAQQILRRGDRDGDRKLSKEEWSALFDQVGGGKALDADAVRKLLFPPAPPRPPKGAGGMPPKEVLLLGLLTGELGSAAEGPALEAPAPNFTLASPDGKTTITLGDYRGKKPVVLIFGSFT